MKLMSKLWQDEAGVIVSTEIILVLMILVFGAIAGMVALRDQVNQELGDTGLMIGSLSQTYAFTGNSNNGDLTAANAETPSSTFVDNEDLNDGVDTDATAPGGILLELPVAAGGAE